VIDATVMSAPTRNRHSVCLRISALSTADVDAVIQDLDKLCTDVIHTHVMDTKKHGEALSSLTDAQVLFSCS